MDPFSGSSAPPRGSESSGALPSGFGAPTHSSGAQLPPRWNESTGAPPSGFGAPTPKRPSFWRPCSGKAADVRLRGLVAAAGVPLDLQHPAQLELELVHVEHRKLEPDLVPGVEGAGGIARVLDRHDAGADLAIADGCVPELARPREQLVGALARKLERLGAHDQAHGERRSDLGGDTAVHEQVV